MGRLLSRTSITIDEAVHILLGRSTGPIELWPLEDSEEANAERPMFSLQDHLDDELEVLAGEYEQAKYEKRRADVIDEKLAALRQQEAVIEQANRHLCAIQDELNKGEQSVLKMDTALSNAVYAFITLHSFNEWLKSSAGLQPGAVPSTESVPVSMKGSKKKPRDRLNQQEDAIVAEIRKQGLDSMALPPNRSGHAGVKATVREALEKSPLFEGTTTFDKAWERLRKQSRIVYEP